jgi:hypothetical protein
LGHPGRTPRPQGDYFIPRRHNETAQGDIFDRVPIWLPPFDVLEPWDVTKGEAMVLTPSCLIDRTPEDGLILVAPVVTVGERDFRPADLAILQEDDCLHSYFYLPPEGPFAERVVEFARAQPIRRALLERCERPTQLTYEATQQLMRKLTIYFTRAHPDATSFEPPADDFPDEDFEEEPA